MDNRFFNTVMPNVNEQWAAEVLNMQWNKRNGPDLFDDKKIAEVKFLNKNYLDSINYLGSWTVFDFQFNYKTDKKRYWALGTYTLSLPISSIRTTNPKNLEDYVIKRELNIVAWNWMQQFKPHDVRGQTEHSNWKNTFRYAKRAKLPKATQQYKVKKGIVYLTEGVDVNDFIINTLPANPHP